MTPSLLTTIFAFLLLLGPLVLIHELGHYLVGRWFGVGVTTFSIGFGKELAGWTDKRGTRWKLSALPLGGYVQFAGDWNAISMPDGNISGMSEAERAVTFHAKPLWQRALIVAAGPVVNLVFAFAIFAAFNFALGKPVATPEVMEFAAASPAREAGMKAGDLIVAIEGAAIDNFTDIPEHVAPYPGRTLAVTVRRDGRELTLPVKVATTVEKDSYGNEAKIGRIGIKAGKVAVQPLGAVESLSLAGTQTWGVIRMMVTGITQIVSGERSVKELGGPIRIAQYSGQQFSAGWLSFVSFAALISINLAFINFLPIPGLDGGHLAFYAAEAVRRKPLNARSQEWAFRTGMALVLALMLFVTLNDLANLPLFKW